MKLYAHVGLSGNIQGLIAVPDGEMKAMLLPTQAVEVYEIPDHGMDTKSFDLNKFEDLLNSNIVQAEPAKGKLVRSKK